MSDEHKFGWGLFLFGVVVCVVTALLLPKFVVAALVFAGLCAAAGAYLLDWLSTPLRAIASLIIIIGGLALLGWAVWPAPELPRVAITGYDVILFKPYQSTFVNIYFRNVGGPGNITIYSAAGFALATANPTDIKHELDSFIQKGLAAGGGLSFSLKPQEIKWFTVIGPLLTPQQAELLRKGTYAFYFSGTIIRGFDGRNYDFCSFVEGNKPNVVLQCPEQ
jgi:hypothetical protein